MVDESIREHANDMGRHRPCRRLSNYGVRVARNCQHTNGQQHAHHLRPPLHCSKPCKYPPIWPCLTQSGSWHGGLLDTSILYTISHCTMRRDMLGAVDGEVDANDSSSNSGTR